MWKKLSGGATSGQGWIVEQLTKGVTGLLGEVQDIAIRGFMIIIGVVILAVALWAMLKESEEK